MFFLQFSAVLYLVLLCWLLLHSTSQNRYFWSILDPNLNVPLPEQVYGADCRIYTPEYSHISRFKNIKIALDEFVLAHTFGWIFKTFLYRDLLVSWISSILFEFTEMSLMHVLPNFNECWWDSWILDVLLCNSIGIFFGHLFLEYFNIKIFNWIGLEYRDKTTNILKRSVWPYAKLGSPSTWGISHSLPRYLSLIGLLALSTITELNCFFLKNVFWLRPSHWIVVMRLVLMCFLSMKSIDEFYCYTFMDEKNPKLGAIPTKLTTFCLTLSILLMESAVWIKCSEDLIASSDPTPPAVIIIWLFVSALLIFLGLIIWRHQQHTSLGKSEMSKSA